LPLTLTAHESGSFTV